MSTLSLYNQASTPASPASGYLKVYYKTDGSLYAVDSAGNVTLLTSASADAARKPVRVASTAAIVSMVGLLTVDGVVTVAGNRVLVKNQSTASQNGIYVVAAGSWSRAADFAVTSTILGGVVVAVQEGATNADQLYMLTNDGTIIVGTTNLTFAQVGALPADHSITNAKLRQGVARSVIGVAGNATADVADIAGAGSATFLRDSGTGLAFSALSLSDLPTTTVLDRNVFMAADFDDPNNSDWPVTVAAELTVDSVNNAMGVRRFDDTTEEGVSFVLYSPLGATNIKFTFVWRAQTAPGVTKGVQPSIRVREFPHQASVESYAETDFTPLSVPTTTQWQYSSETISLATLSCVAGRMTQMELTRQGADADDTLAGDWVVAMLVVEFT